MRFRVAGATKVRKVPKESDALETGRATRRRDEVLMTAIREATSAELAEYGYAGVTFRGVARRARTSKHVLYRRYRSRAHMVLDALPAFSWPPQPSSTPGSLREELLAILSALVDRFERIGIDTYCGLLSELDEALLDEFIAEMSQRFSHPVRSALSHAVDRGEIGPAHIPDRVVTAIITLLREELLFSRRTVSRQTLIELIDTVYIPLVTVVSHQQVP